jgi:exosortase
LVPTAPALSAPASPPGLPLSARALQLLCVGLAAALCVPAVHNMPVIWSRTEFLAHGYLIPLVSLFLLASNRHKLAEGLRTGRPPLAGAALVLVAAAAMAVAVLGDVGFAAGLMVPVLLLATLFAVGGAALLRPALVPVGFLALMVRPPDFLTTELLFRLKLLVTRSSVSLLQAAGQTVAANGNEILVPGHTLFVADACSGLSSIITLIPLGCVIAYFVCSGVWRRLVVVASIVPLAVGANILRVLVTVAVVSRYGIEFAQGLLHESFGMTTYVAGTVALVLVAKLAQAWPPR